MPRSPARWRKPATSGGCATPSRWHRRAKAVARAEARVLGLCPGARSLVVGHFGDGNVHYNIAQPIDMPKAEFLARWEELAHAVEEVALAFGGSISAEHGIGQMKRRELARVRLAVELDLMRALKAALDPRGILNPAKLL